MADSRSVFELLIRREFKFKVFNLNIVLNALLFGN